MIFIPNENPDRTLQKVYLEQYENFDILWYLWPKDGHFNVLDYEPIILVYRNQNKLCCISPRRAWEYQPDLFYDIEYPIEIVFGGWFEGIYHHPYVRHKGFDTEFETQKTGKIETYYEIEEISDPSKIPSIARIGENHPSKRLKPWIEVMDPAEKAEEIYNEYCV